MRRFGALFVVALVLTGAAMTFDAPFAGPMVASAASPQPSGGAGDTRSAGEAPGFVGAPFVAVAAVLLLGGVAAAATLLYVRLTGGPGRTGGDPGTRST